MNEIFIFTEIVNCGKIGKIALDSFHKYHNQKVHVYGTKSDFEKITTHHNNILIGVDNEIIDGYRNNGHVGTALLWEKVIRECKEKYIIHFDSDTIFRENIIDEIIEKSKEYDIIGPIRNYHHNPQGIKEIMHLTDLCQTNCILFNKEKISKHYLGEKNNEIPINKILNLSLKSVLKLVKYNIRKILGRIHMSVFAQMIHGSYPLFKYKTIDFFDQVMFDMVDNGAKIYHLDFNDVGGCDKYGKRNNLFEEINNFPTPYKIDFGRKLAHFSCVGSGMNFYNNKESTKNISPTYVECALDRYALFCKTFYNEELTDINLDKYEKIFSIKNWY
ncbi:hypothetical protein IT399_00970 [Candidatus Nomurabacteria bacterium]|nr:hypothetical protein [Candidatus Nomurabacteria bacterium]